MKKKGLSVIFGLLLIAFSSPAMAHSLWVNLFESYAHPPGHAMVSLGWGHAIPMDDLLASSSGTVYLASYDLIDPDGNKTSLGLPSMKGGETIEAKGALKIEAGDLGIRKLAFTKETKPGTWQVVATNKTYFFTKYIDTKGRQRMAHKPIDAIPDVAKVLASIRHQTYAKSFTAVKKWSRPKPLGHELEIMPLTDLSKVHAGDTVGFDVNFMGKPFSSSLKNGIQYMTAKSNTFGGNKCDLISYLMDGKAQFLMPTAGQWVVKIHVRQDVTPESNLKNLVGKCTTVYYSGTISFSVEP